MTNPVLIVYDNTGRVWGLYHGETTVPDGIQGIIADAPKNFKSVSVNPATKVATFELLPDTEDEITNLQECIIGLEERITALEEKLV